MGRLATQMEDSCSVLAAGQRVGEEAFLPQRVTKVKAIHPDICSIHKLGLFGHYLYAYIHLTITIK